MTRQTDEQIPCVRFAPFGLQTDMDPMDPCNGDHPKVTQSREVHQTSALSLDGTPPLLDSVWWAVAATTLSVGTSSPMGSYGGALSKGPPGKHLRSQKQVLGRMRSLDPSISMYVKLLLRAGPQWGDGEVDGVDASRTTLIPA